MATCAICLDPITAGQRTAVHETEIMHRACVSPAALRATHATKLEAKALQQQHRAERLQLELDHARESARAATAKLRSEKDEEIERLRIENRRLREQRDEARNERDAARRGETYARDRAETYRRDRGSDSLASPTDASMDEMIARANGRYAISDPTQRPAAPPPAAPPPAAATPAVTPAPAPAPAVKPEGDLAADQAARFSLLELD